MKGGNLGRIFEEMMISAQKMSEESARTIITQILRGVSHIHSKGIIHRDLKPDNVLFLNKGSFEDLKLVDFGLSTEFSHQNPLCLLGRKCGTPLYMAPEVFQEKNSSKVLNSFGE